MKIAILGTGMVGQNLALAFAGLGHQIMIGTRDVASTLANIAPSPYGQPGFGVWHKDHAEIGVGTYEEAIAFGDILVNATNGLVSLDALAQGKAETAGAKILIDIGNKLQPVAGAMPKSLARDESSLGEDIQAAFPNLKVVKTLSTMNTYVMSNPASVPADTSVFVCGNDEDAKVTVVGLLSALGWSDIIDVGDISGARGVEMMLPVWLRLVGRMGGKPFNFKIVR
jgi:8-hydroxy-5-deazaflavin:NADPH oxidoreductase